MLNKKFQYVAVDFETTGLDIEKEEPIQIGIVQCDESANVIDAYVSYIKPTKDVKDLKQIVTLITGLSLSDVVDAPPREQVYDDIKKHIKSNAILIGHNIGFDMAFLKKYWDSCTVAWQIDTYTLSLAMMHYQKSYALESLTQSIYDNPIYQSYYNKIKQQVEKLSEMKAHDALYDCVQSQALFFYIVDRIQQLQTTYPSLNQCLSKSQWIFSAILPWAKQSAASISFPLLERMVSPQRSVAKQANDSFFDTTHQQCYIGKNGFKNFLAEVTQHKIVLAFSHRSKIDIAKNILNELGHTNISYIKEEQYIDQRQFDLRLNKSHMTESEFLFCCKYLSQHEQWFGIVDIKTLNDKSILHTIQKKLDYKPQDIVLATHGGLYALLENKLAIDTQWLEDYTIVYADLERWYTSYNKYANNSFDPYYVLDWITTLCYKYDVRATTRGEVAHKQANEKMKKLYAGFAIWLALWTNEMGEFFKKRKSSSIIASPLLDSLDCYHSSKIWHNVLWYVKEVLPLLTSLEAKRLESMINNLSDLLQTMVKIERKLSNGYVIFTLAHEVSFTDFSELLALFAWYNNVLVSNTAQWHHPMAIANTYPQTQKAFAIKDVNGFNSFLQELSEREKKENESPIFFVVSTRKNLSKGFLDKLYKQWMHKKYDLLVENITGGIGKLVMKAKKPWPKIIIGGYHFLLQLFSQKQKIDICFILNIVWGLKDQILADIRWYGANQAAT